MIVLLRKLVLLMPAFFLGSIISQAQAQTSISIDQFQAPSLQHSQGGESITIYARVETQGIADGTKVLGGVAIHNM